MIASRLIRQTRPSTLAVSGLARRFVSELPRSNAAPGQPIAPPPPFPPAAAGHTAYAASPPPPPPFKKKAGFFKKAWRVTYLSALAGLGWFTYEVYQNRHPGQQFEQDPSKKTIVILGSGWGSCALLKNIHAEDYNVVIVSPRNYFLFTPLLPSTTTGTVELRSIMEPIRHMTRHKKAAVKTYEADCTKIDPERKTITITDNTELKGAVAETELKYDYLVVGVGAENQTFGIKGVRENACFLKETWDAQKIRTRIMDCIETAQFKTLPEEEKERLLHMVVVGGGPTGIEFAAELRDFFNEDLLDWYPEIKDKFKVTLIEALPSVLPMFSKQLIDYTESNFKKQDITIHTKTMVKEVTERDVTCEVTKPDGTKQTQKVPYGLLVWATGNTPRPLIKNMMAEIPAQKNSRRGLAVNDFMVVEGSENIWAIGDCTATKYAPTAQAASQQGTYLSHLFNDMAKSEKLEGEINYLMDQMSRSSSTTAEERASLKKTLDNKKRALNAIKATPFEYSHQGSLAYVGRGDAIADLQIPFFNGSFSSGGASTYLFWRAAYISQVFSLRNRALVVFDYTKTKLLGRDISRQ